MADLSGPEYNPAWTLIASAFSMDAVDGSSRSLALASIAAPAQSLLA